MNRNEQKWAEMFRSKQSRVANANSRVHTGSPSAHRVHTSCTQGAHKLYTSCTQDVHKLFTSCTQTAVHCLLLQWVQWLPSRCTWHCVFCRVCTLFTPWSVQYAFLTISHGLVSMLRSVQWVKCLTSICTWHCVFWGVCTVFNTVVCTLYILEYITLFTAAMSAVGTMPDFQVHLALWVVHCAPHSTAYHTAALNGCNAFFPDALGDRFVGW